MPLGEMPYQRINVFEQLGFTMVRRTCVEKKEERCQEVVVGD
jgi:hypothetical protein